MNVPLNKEKKVFVTPRLTGVALRFTCLLQSSHMSTLGVAQGSFSTVRSVEVSHFVITTRGPCAALWETAPVNAPVLGRATVDGSLK